MQNGPIQPNPQVAAAKPWPRIRRRHTRGWSERVRSAGDDGLVHAAVAVSDRVAGSVQARDHLAVGVEYLELVVAAHARGGAVEVVGRLLDGVAVVPQVGVEHVIEIGYCHARSAR